MNIGHNCHAARNQGFGLWLVLLIAAHPVAGQTVENLGVTGGVIAEVTEGGRLIFDDRSSVALWGLEVTDRNAAQSLLFGRMTSCVIVTQSGDDIAADCDVAPKSWAVGTGLDWLNLLVWLPELGIARMVCGIRDATNGTERHQNNRFYRCITGDTPFRVPPSPPTAPMGGLY